MVRYSFRPGPYGGETLEIVNWPKARNGPLLPRSPPIDPLDYFPSSAVLAQQALTPVQARANPGQQATNNER